MSELLCNDCLDTGWLEDKAGRSVCSCIAETEPYQQLQAEVERLRGERDELKAVVMQIVDRIVPLTPVVLAAINARESE